MKKKVDEIEFLFLGIDDGLFCIFFSDAPDTSFCKTREAQGLVLTISH